MRWKRPGCHRPVEQFSDEWRQRVHIALQKISWKWVCGALLVRKFANGSDDVIIGEDAKNLKTQYDGTAS